jgi:hypothetical protein
MEYSGPKSGAFIAPIVMKDANGNERKVIDTSGNFFYGFQSGNQFFVDSGGTGASDSNDGLSWSSALATLDAAIAKCTANNGDIVWVAPGHAETYTTTGTKLAVDIAGVTILGLGSGGSRPAFTFGHTGATWAISAASAYLQNLLLVTDVDLVTTFGTISGVDCTFVDIETRDTTNKEVIDTFITTAAADRLVVIRHFHNGYTAGDANARVWNLVGCNNALFENCRFMSKVTTAVINFTGTACTNVIVRASTFLVTSTTDFSKTVVDTVGGSTWEVVDCFDLGAGASFSGGSGGALAGDDISAVNAALLFPTQDLATDATIAQVVGKKSDTVSGTSIVSLVKQVIAATLFPTTDLATDATIAQVVGKKADTVGGNSIVSLVKQAIAALLFPTTDLATDATIAQVVGKKADTVAGTSLVAIGRQTIAQANRTTTKKTAATPVTQNLFTVAGGAVRIINIVGHITTALAAGANNTKLVHTSTGGAAIDLCAVLDTASAAIRLTLGITGVAANAMIKSAAEGVQVAAEGMTNPITITPGVISLNCSAGTTGVIDWYIEYEPMASGATIVPA